MSLELAKGESGARLRAKTLKIRERFLKMRPKAESGGERACERVRSGQKKNLSFLGRGLAQKAGFSAILILYRQLQAITS